MADLKMSELCALQNALQEKYKGQWEEIIPRNGRSKLLWMVEELGEVVAIIKKRGDGAMMNEPEVRQAFLEEMADVMMYFCDILACYNVSAEEFCAAFAEKHEYNMNRDYGSGNKEFLPGKKSEIAR